jgi:hypothetical protein
VTRILYWNINNFSLNKIADPTNLVAAQDRRAHIVDEVLRGLPALPDIFVIVEVFARMNDAALEGHALYGNARTGSRMLLTRIRTQTGNGNWALIPPVWSGKQGFCEGVAVYYNATNVQFTGPYVYGPDFRTAGQTRSGAWSTAPSQRACPLTDTAQPAMTPALPANPNWTPGPRAYSAAVWGNVLPNRVTPGGVLPTENMLAGQWEFYDAMGARIYFPADFNRSPYYTRFLDLANGRTIKLFAMHTSPGAAVQAVQLLATVQELAAANHEVTVVVGDFNVDTFTSRATYDALVGNVAGTAAGLGMTMAFRAEDALAIRPARLPYCLTHVLPTARATPNGLLGGVVADPTHDAYPRFGYMGSMGGVNFQTPVNTAAIDNVLTLYGGGLAVGPATNATIVNTVVGQPYGAAGAIANVTAELTGGLVVNSTLANAIPQPNGQNSTAAGAAATTALFQLWGNFDRIRSTSDHLAIAIDV